MPNWNIRIDSLKSELHIRLICKGDDFMASFRKRGKYWTYRIRVKGFNDEWKEYTGGGFHSKPEARKAAMQREVELKNNEHHGGKMLFKVFGEMWLENYVKNKLKPNTYKTYRNAIRDHAGPAFGDMYLQEIRPMAYQKFVDNIIEGGLAHSTARRVHNAIYQCMKRAVLNGYITKNPCENVVIKKLPVKKLKFIEPSLVPQILEYLYRRDYSLGLFFETLFETGMRKGECAALRLDDIDWRENTLRVDQTLDFQPEEGDDLLGDPKTYSSTRIIKMRPKYMQKLKTYVKYRTEQKMLVGSLYSHELNLVFARDGGNPISKSTLWNAFKSSQEHLELEPIPIHSTRHTHVAMLIEAGWDMKSIADRLGHESATTTINTYAHISHKHAENTLHNFDEYMEKLGQ